MPVSLTPEEKDKLLKGLTKYASEGANDEQMRRFRDAFISELKKKGGGQPDSGSDQKQPGQPSAPSFGQKVVTDAFVSGQPVMKGVQKKPVQKKPYQDITYKREELPSETTQMPETPVVKAAKKDFKQTQLKPQAQIKSTQEELEEIQKKTEKADQTGLILNDYQSTGDIYNDLKSLNDEDVNVVFTRIQRRPDLYAKYSGRTPDEVANIQSYDTRELYEADRDLVYKNYLADLESQSANHNKAVAKANVVIKDILDKQITPETYNKYTKEKKETTSFGEITAGPVIDMDKVDETASAIAEKYNLPTDGDAWRLIKNELKSSVETEIIRPDAEVYYEKNYPELNKKRQEMFESGFKADEQIYAKVDSVLTSLENQYQQDAKNELNAIDAEYKTKADQLNDEYARFSDDLKKQQDALTESYQSGQIDRLEYETSWSNLSEQDKVFYENYKKQFPDLTAYVTKANEINSKYNRKYQLQRDAIASKADAEMKEAYKRYALEYKEDPELLKQINDAYRDSFEKATEARAKKMGTAAQLSINPVSSLYQSTASALGGVFKGWGGSLDSKALEVLGESMEQTFMMPQARTKEFSDWVDPQNLILLTGQLGGSMIPSMAAGAAVAIGTQGAGAPVAAQLIAGGLAGWATETVDTVGRSYLDRFEKTNGNIAEANLAAERSLQSQYDIMFTYAFDALPFVGKALKFIPSKAGRVVAGGTTELVTETAQEYPQNIADENIQAGNEPWTNLNEALKDTRRMKETLISVGPVAILGGAGQLGSTSKKSELTDAYIAMQQKSSLNTALPDQKRQYVQNMVFNKDAKFANGVVGTLFTTGQIDEQTSKDLMVEIERAERIKESGKSAGLSGSKLNVYGFYSARAEEAERNAAKFGHDPILHDSYKEMAKQYRNAGLDFMKGGKPDILTITYADGSQAMMMPEDANALFSDATALDLLSKKAVTVSAYKEGGDGIKVIDELKTRAEAYSKKNRYTEASTISSPLQTIRENIRQRTEQLDAEQADLTEKQRQAEIKKIEDEEIAAFESKAKEFEAKKRDERDLEIEQVQQQREALGVNDVSAFFSDMKPLIATTVERMETGQSAPQSAVKAASDYLYAKYKELSAMKSDPNRMMTIAQIESVQAQIEQDLQTLEGNPPSQKVQINDQENIQGLPGQVGVGQESVETQPIEVTSEEAAPAGGVLQAQEEVTPQVTEETKPEVKPGRRERLARLFEEPKIEVTSETTVSEEPVAEKTEEKPTEEKPTTVKISEAAPSVRRVGAVEASEDSNENAGAESALSGVEMDEAGLEDWKKKNKAPSKRGRIEELTQAVQDLLSGKIKFKEYYEKAKQLMPSRLMEKVPTPASLKEVVGSIDKNKLGIGIINLNKFVKKGMKVGLRIDIPAFNNFGKNVVTVHDRTGSGQPVIGYGSTGSISNVTFRTSVSTAAKIGAGEQKSAFAMAEGQWMDESPESIQKRAEEALNSPEWVQVGMNPTRNSFFFDKADGNPVVAADEVLQVGNLVLAKNPQKIDLNTEEGMAQFEKQFSGKTKEGVTYQYRKEKPSPGDRIRKMFETSEGMIAAGKVEEFLKESGIDVVVLDSQEFTEIGKQRNFEGDADGVFLFDNNTGKIYLNREKIKTAEGKTIAFHEGIHPVINIIRNTNPKLYQAIVKGLKEEAARNKGVAEAAAAVASSEEYQRRGPESIEDETVVETMARVAAGDINIDTFEPNFREKFIEFMNKIAKALGIGPIAVNSPRMEVQRLAKQLTTALNEGGKISDIVGKKNVGKFQSQISIDDTNSVFSNTSSQARFEMKFLEDSEDFTKLVKEGRVVHNATLDDINGETVVIHNPDNFSTGDIKFRGKDLVKGEGGVYFVLLYDDVWASGKKSSASQLASLINESLQKSTDGKGRLVLVKGDSSKNLTSVKGAKALMGVMEILADDGLIPLSAFRKALNIAGKKYGINFDGRNDAKSIHKDIQDKFMNVSNSSFERRGDFVRDVIDAIANQNVLSKEAIAEIAESIGAKRKMTTFSKASILDSVAYATSERMLREIPNSHVYAVIETSSKVKPEFVGKHESYPWHIVTEDGSKPILYILKDRPFYNDAFVAAKSTEKVKEGERFGDVSRAGLAQRGMGLAKVDTKPTVQPSKGIKRGSNLVKDTYYESGLTEDKNDYVFFHVSSAPKASIMKGIDSTKYTSLRTSREEKGLQYGVASYYTRPEDGERMVGGDKYAVRVPKGKVYPIDSDPMGYGEKAEQNVPQGTPFRGEAVKREIADMAKKDGYQMIVGEWAYSRTGKPAGEIPEFRADALVPLKPTAEKPDSFTSNAEKGMERVPFPGQQSEEAKQELETLASEIVDILSGKKKFSSEEYQIANDIYMSGQVRENRNEDDEFNRDITEQEYDRITKVLPKSMQAEAARVRGLLFGGKKTVQPSIRIPRTPKEFSSNVSETIDRIKATTKEDGATLNLDGTTYDDGGLVVPASSINVAQNDVSGESLYDFVKNNEENISSDIFKVGLYKFPDRPEVSYDLNIVIPREYRAVALEFGRLAGQESLFDLDTYENVKTGADGKNPRTFTAEELAEIAQELSQGKLPKAVSEEIAIGYRGLPGEYVQDYNGIQYFAENEKYAGVFGKNIIKANISKNKILDLDKWNKKLKDAGIPDNGMGQPFLTIDQSMFDENRNFTTKGREGTFGKMKRAIGLEEFNKFKEEFDNSDVIYGEDAGNVGEMVYAVKNPKAISVSKRGQLSTKIPRTQAQVREAAENAIDAVEESIADGVDPQQAIDENISNQDWYGDLTPAQKEQLNAILQDEFGATASEPKTSSNAQRVADLWEKGGKEAKAEIKNILETDPELSYIYNNFPKITKQLEEQGLLTKTENCP